VSAGGVDMRKVLLYFGFCLVASVVLNAPYQCFSGDKTLLSGKKKSVKSPQGEYRIGNGDILEIITWKEPDFSGEVIVRLDGKITFPLLDDIQAEGRTPVQVKKDIEKRLKEFIEDPIVTVNLKNPVSQKFYILGEIANTGEYPLVKDLTVLQAFALAGGFTEWASKKEIILVRQENGKKKIIRINYKNIIKGINLKNDILLKPNDTIIVP